jgi:branched-chain amino acid transport system substrate-binding protein
MKITTSPLGIAMVTAEQPRLGLPGVGGPLPGQARRPAQMENGVDQAASISTRPGNPGPENHCSCGDDASDQKQGVSVANKFAADGVRLSSAI